MVARITLHQVQTGGLVITGTRIVGPVVSSFCLHVPFGATSLGLLSYVVIIALHHATIHGWEEDV